MERATRLKLERWKDVGVKETTNRCVTDEELQAWKMKKAKAESLQKQRAWCLQQLLAYIYHSPTANENSFWCHQKDSTSCKKDSSQKIIIHSSLCLSKPIWCSFRVEQKELFMLACVLYVPISVYSSPCSSQVVIWSIFMVFYGFSCSFFFALYFFLVWKGVARRKKESHMDL